MSEYPLGYVVGKRGMTTSGNILSENTPTVKRHIDLSLYEEGKRLNWMKVEFECSITGKSDKPIIRESNCMLCKGKSLVLFSIPLNRHENFIIWNLELLQILVKRSLNWETESVFESLMPDGNDAVTIVYAQGIETPEGRLYA